MPDGSTFRRRQRVTVPRGQWPLDHAITVVLFAGLGGACDGLEEAGCPAAATVTAGAWPWCWTARAATWRRS